MICHQPSAIGHQRVAAWCRYFRVRSFRRYWKEFLMGQKVHPYGFRLGYNKTWRSRWYAERDYGKLLHEDLKLKRQLKKRFSHAGVSRVEIERAANKLKINIHTSRPGITHRAQRNRGRQAQIGSSGDDPARGPTSILSKSPGPSSTLSSLPSPLRCS